MVLLSQYDRNCKIIAGGTDVLAKMKKGTVLPEVLLNIKGIRELDYINTNENGILKIGALTSIKAIAESPLVGGKFCILAQAADALGTPAIRRQATIGGNLCNAAPSADTAPPLLVLGAQAVIASMSNVAAIPLVAFIWSLHCLRDFPG